MSVVSTLETGLIKQLYLCLDILDKLREVRNLTPDTPDEPYDSVLHRVNEALDMLERE